MISQTVEYALRAIVTIAQHEGAPCTAKRIAEITQVPAAYLAKLMQGLVRGGLVTSQRGLHGGFVLTNDPANITVYDIVNVVEPIRRIEECPLGIKSHGAVLCPLHSRLDMAIAATEKMFRETVVAELLAQPGNVTPLCEAQQLVTLDVKPAKKKRAVKKTKKRSTQKKKKTGN